MTSFRVLLVVLIAALVAYTVVVIANHGIWLFPVFFGDIAAMGWPGQFNADFLCFLTLGGLWLAWRHEFSALGCAMGAFVYLGGAPFVMTYILIQTFRTNGDMVEVLVGARRAA